MRWIRVTFACLASLLLALWFVSALRPMYTELPLASHDAYLFLEIKSSRVVIITNYRSWQMPMSREEYEAVISAIRGAFKDSRPSQSQIVVSTKEPWFVWEPFSRTNPPTGETWSGTEVVFPVWLPVVIFGLWPLLAIYLWLRRRRYPEGCCNVCGYDLRGTIGGTCPECGARRESDGAKYATPAEPGAKGVG